MHSAYKSDKPGIAPDYGMQLKPVYAGSDPAAQGDRGDSASLAPDTAQVTAEKKQLIGEAQRTLQVTDRLIKAFPEVYRVLGKAGRAETSTDPAPLSMFETVITLKPRSEWRRVPAWYFSWSPKWFKPLFRHFTPDTVSPEQLVDKLNEAVKLPGVSNAWTMLIKARIDMLSAGMRTPVGLKIHGDDLERSQGSVRACKPCCRL